MAFGVILVIIVVAIYFHSRNSSRAKNSSNNTAKMSISSNFLEQERKKVLASIPAGMGALLEFPGDTNVIGYYKDGVVYTKNKLQIGTFENSGMCYFTYDNKKIGYYQSGQIYYSANYPSGFKSVAEIFDYPESNLVHPNDETTHKPVTFIGDRTGAAAAYAILFYGYGKWDDETRRYFEK